MHPDDPIDQKLTPEPPTSRTADGASSEWAIRRHRRVASPRIRALLASTPVRVALATGLTCCLGVAAVATANRDDETPRAQVAESVADRAVAAEDDPASRSLDRSPSPTPASPSPSASPSASSKPTPKKTPKKTTSPKPKKTTPAPPARPKPVAGLTQSQMDNAKVIVDVGVDLDIPRQGLVVAVATAMQESTLLNYASGVLPESQNYPHQAIGWDHDSVGLFQQRPSSGWGSVRDLMRPAYASRAFYEALLKVPGWQQMSLTLAAQAVQISAYPYAYAQHEQRAATIVAALT
ncbi:hypothetical protein [Micromonospora craniellae]|uniref:Peptidase M23 n=1 Tax=Micromonospora craniellae TaxID=2294034 RepID=A0A372FUH6_9ACTN|nr:hypothetical protein [Micromonospora craniellae]QOC92451.1 hypothetical protein ID554_01245 [Micromonospora craniellae]RFS44264.1 hypothetical protein D0Q02_23030 [Micromonospora craniellae]